MANNTTLRDGNGALFTAESFDQGGGLQRTSTAANIRVANTDVAATNPVPIAPIVAGSPVSSSNPLPVSIGASSVSIGTVAVSTDAQANAAAPAASEGASVPLSVDLGRNLRIFEGSGAAITGATMPTGGVGLTGWLSAIWSKLSGLLQANLYIGGTVASASNAVPMFDAYAAPVQNAAWTSATAVNTAFTLATAGNDTVVLTAALSGTITAGAIMFEGYDGYNWVNIKAPRTDSYLTDGTFALAGSTTHSWQIPVAGYPQFRARLSTAIVGSGSVQLVGIVSSAPDTSIVTVGLDPSQPLPAGTNALGTVGVTGSVAVTGSFYQATQPVSGTVAVSGTTTIAETAGTAITGASMPAGGVGLTGWLSAIWSKLSSALSIVSANPTTMISGQQTATTSAAALPSQVLVNGVNVIALSTNTGLIYIGPSGVTASTGYPLIAGQAFPIAVTNLNAVYMVGTNTTDKLAWGGN